MRRVRTACAIATAVMMVGLFPAVGRSAEPAYAREEFSGSLQILNDLAAQGAFSGGAGQISKATCQSSGDPKATIDISCDGNTDPDNETPIVIDPSDPNHLLAGSNDYHIFIKGSSITARVPTGFFVSFDGGKTWTDGQIPMGSGGSGGNGDPTPAFDAKHGVALMGQLTAGCGQLGPYCGNISASVSRSRDGGLTWNVPVTVAQGSGSLTPSADGVFIDKPWLTVDNDPTSPYYGRAYLAYTKYQISRGDVLESPIFLTTSGDGGKTWTTPKEISGSNSNYCTIQASGPAGACDEDEFSTPVLLPGGTVVVHFENQQNQRAWESPDEFENQTMVVRSTDGGATWSNPSISQTSRTGPGPTSR
jgi:hypothetical protein